MECIKYILCANNWKIVQSTGDGHCLVYSTMNSWNNQLYNNPPINKPWLLEEIRNEFNQHRERYTVFLTDLEQEQISRQLILYLDHNRYNLDIVDVIPSVISNILNVSLKLSTSTIMQYAIS